MSELAPQQNKRAADGLPAGTIQGVLSDLVAKNEPGQRLSQQQIADKWGITFGQVSSIRNTHKMELEEVRASMVARNIGNAYLAQEILHDHLTDPVKRSKISARDVSTIAKQAQDSALNMANGMVGAPAQINFGDIKVLAKMDFGKGFQPVEAKKVKVIDQPSEP